MAGAVLLALASPVLGMRTALPGDSDLPRSIPVVKVYDRLVTAFPSQGPEHAVVVWSRGTRSLDRAAVGQALDTLAGAAGRSGLLAASPTPVPVSYSSDGRVVSRVREAARRGVPIREAIATGVASSAGVVTSAALVMVAVFAIFATLTPLDLKQMGVGLAVAILLDATVVRAVLLPAATALLGGRNWWLPGWLHRLPDLAAAPGPG